jgi:hypothetical protein
LLTKINNGSKFQVLAHDSNIKNNQASKKSLVDVQVSTHDKKQGSSSILLVEDNDNHFSNDA